jgi:hypothetical protein
MLVYYRHRHPSLIAPAATEALPGDLFNFEGATWEVVCSEEAYKQLFSGRLDSTIRHQLLEKVGELELFWLFYPDVTDYRCECWLKVIGAASCASH